MTRPWGFAAMDATLDALEEHLRKRALASPIQS
jgi:hypothetical protein